MATMSDKLAAIEARRRALDPIRLQLDPPVTGEQMDAFFDNAMDDIDYLLTIARALRADGLDYLITLEQTAEKWRSALESIANDQENPHVGYETMWDDLRTLAREALADETNGNT